MKTSLTAKQIRDKLKGHIYASDEVLTLDVTDRGWTGTGFGSFTWLKKNM